MTNQQLLEKLKEDNINYLKYVRLHDNTFRFATTDYFAPNHKDLVTNTEIPISAAYVKIKQRYP